MLRVSSGERRVVSLIEINGGISKGSKERITLGRDDP